MYGTYSLSFSFVGDIPEIYNLKGNASMFPFSMYLIF